MAWSQPFTMELISNEAHVPLFAMPGGGGGIPSTPVLVKNLGPGKLMIEGDPQNELQPGRFIYVNYVGATLYAGEGGCKVEVTYADRLSH